MKEKCAPFPRSNATNAYDLMNDVCKDILAVPARMNMDNWVSSRSDMSRAKQLTFPKVTPPECGTIACFAGWVNLEATGKSGGGSDASNILAPYPSYRVNVWGTKEFDYSNPKINRLRNALDNAYLNMRVRKDRKDLTPGTRAYARVVVKRFRKIMKRFKTQLQATPVNQK